MSIDPIGVWVTARTTSRQIGAALGAALLPAVAESLSRGMPVSGDRAAIVTAAAALAATAVAWRAARPPRYGGLRSRSGRGTPLSRTSWVPASPPGPPPWP